MMTYSFPNDPSNRRVVIVLQEHDIEKCAYEPEGASFLLDKEAYLLPFPLPLPSKDNIPVALQNILDTGLARPGYMLVQSPYDINLYEEASLAPQRFALAKHMYFSMLCMHLGAKEVIVEQIDLRIQSGGSTLEVKGGKSGVVNAKLTAEFEELDKFQAQMNLRDEFNGGPANIEAAEQLLRRTSLWADSNMRTLIEMRREGVNQLKTRKLVLSLSSEAKSNLKVVGRIEVPKFVRLSIDYERVINEQQEYILTVTVNF